MRCQISPTSPLFRALLTQSMVLLPVLARLCNKYRKLERYPLLSSLALYPHLSQPQRSATAQSQPCYPHPWTLPRHKFIFSITHPDLRPRPPRLYLVLCRLRRSPNNTLFLEEPVNKTISRIHALLIRVRGRITVNPHQVVLPSVDGVTMLWG